MPDDVSQVVLPLDTGQGPTSHEYFYSFCVKLIVCSVKLYCVLTTDTIPLYSFSFSMS